MAKVQLKDVRRALFQVQEALREITQVLELFERQSADGKLPAEIDVPDDFADVCAQTGEKAGYAKDC